MKTKSLKSLAFTDCEILQKEQLKAINGGKQVTHCYVEIHYDDGYVYTAGQGTDLAGCRALVGFSWTDHAGTATVDSCFCTSY